MGSVSGVIAVSNPETLSADVEWDGTHAEGDRLIAFLTGSRCLL